MNICSKCGINNPLTEYHLSDNRVCKQCVKEYAAEWYKKNSEASKSRNKKWYKTDIGKIFLKNKRHSRRTKTKQGDVTTTQLLHLEQNAKVCYWCNVSIKNKVVHIDHYVPLSVGGEHTISNLVVSCSKCNLKKHAKDPIKFANSIGRLL